MEASSWICRHAYARAFVPFLLALTRTLRRNKGLAGLRKGAWCWRRDMFRRRTDGFAVRRLCILPIEPASETRYSNDVGHGVYSRT